MGIWNSSYKEINTLTNNRRLFKTCSFCQKSWADREQFLSDPELVVVGYQVHFKDLNKGLFLFHHVCGTSLAIYAGEFIDLYHGPLLTENKFGSDECPEYCLRKEELAPCPVKCECAYVRDILQVVRNWPKDRLNMRRSVSK